MLSIARRANSDVASKIFGGDPPYIKFLEKIMYEQDLVVEKIVDYVFWKWVIFSSCPLVWVRPGNDLWKTIHNFAAR